MNTPTIEIIRPGPLATIQDRGRLGYQHMGVPVSGAMDLCAMRIGNALVGNDQYEACIEVTFGGLEAVFLKKTLFAVTGPNEKATLNDFTIPSWTAMYAAKGDRLILERSATGGRDYLFLEGGVDVPVVLGSKSTYLRGRFGGMNGRPLRKGDILHTGKPGGKIVRNHPWSLIPPYSQQLILRVVLGPQDDCITEEGLNAFTSGIYRLTDRADRMGCALKGPRITHQKGPDIISDGIALGAVQVPGSGQPMILLADRPTTGGYVKIATVISQDISLIAQAAPGAEVRFSPIPLLKAREIYLKKEYALRRFILQGEPL